MGCACTTSYFPVGKASCYCHCCGMYCGMCGASTSAVDQQQSLMASYDINQDQVGTGLQKIPLEDKLKLKKDSIYEKPHDLYPKHDKDHIHWGYDDHNGPACWGDLNHNYVMAIHGKQQSPINIISQIDQKRTRNSVGQSQDIRIAYPEFNRDCNIVNNGHTVQVNINDGGMLTLYSKQYQLKQFHFHSPSEHTVDAKPYDLEMHLVHVNKDDNSLAVMGFFFHGGKKPPAKLKRSLTKMRMDDIQEIDDDDKDNDNDDDDDEFNVDLDDDDDDNQPVKPKHTKSLLAIPVNSSGGGGVSSKKKVTGNEFLEQFWDQLPHTKNVKHPVKIAHPISFDLLFESCAFRFKRIKKNEISCDMNIFHYEGSLTTPPCTEGVKWLVAMKPQWASTKQIHKIKGCWGYITNARPVQEYHGRVVTLCSNVTIHH